jgi:hypothetical protein
VNEDVFAYSNRSGGERTLVVYHNRYADARGWIRSSVAFAEKTGHDGNRVLRSRTLGEGLGLTDDAGRWVVFRDSISGLEYLRNSRDIVRDGLHVELDAYRCQVFVGFRDVADGGTHQYRRLADRLAGRGVPSIDDALRELQLEPVHAPLRRLLEAGLLRSAAGADLDVAGEIERRHRELLAAVAEATGTAGDAGAAAGIARRARTELVRSGRSTSCRRGFDGPVTTGTRGGRGVVAQLALDPASRPVLAIWALLHEMGRLADGAVDAGAAVDAGFVARTSRAWLDELRLGPVIAGAFRGLGLDEGRAWEAVDLVRVLITLPRAATIDGVARRRIERLIAAWLADDDVRPFIRVNRWEGVAWFNREAFEQLTAWMLVLDAVEASTDDSRPATEVARVLAKSHGLLVALRAAGESSGYQIDRLVAGTKPVGVARKPTTPSGGSAPSSGPRARGRRTAPTIRSSRSPRRSDRGAPAGSVNSRGAIDRPGRPAPHLEEGQTVHLVMKTQPLGGRRLPTRSSSWRCAASTATYRLQQLCDSQDGSVAREVLPVEAALDPDDRAAVAQLELRRRASGPLQLGQDEILCCDHPCPAKPRVIHRTPAIHRRASPGVPTPEDEVHPRDLRPMDQAAPRPAIELDRIVDEVDVLEGGSDDRLVAVAIKVHDDVEVPRGPRLGIRGQGPRARDVVRNFETLETVEDIPVDVHPRMIRRRIDIGGEPWAMTSSRCSR